jgi:hypothetical protein
MRMIGESKIRVLRKNRSKNSGALSEALTCIKNWQAPVFSLLRAEKIIAKATATLNRQ